MDDGTFGGHDGCNSFRTVPFEADPGHWSREGDKISFHGLWASTEMACWPNSAYYEADTIVVVGEDLHLYRDGDLIGTMIPS